MEKDYIGRNKDYIGYKKEDHALEGRSCAWGFLFYS